MNIINAPIIKAKGIKPISFFALCKIEAPKLNICSETSGNSLLVFALLFTFPLPTNPDLKKELSIPARKD
ncbi:MAG: hypothetical protein D6B28_03175 [Gammaproteobacteria bacterium]|nr:MAG: hypothetical protein D6B28_03175 [Gammaproteobacteria bacterium]